MKYNQYNSFIMKEKKYFMRTEQLKGFKYYKNKIDKNEHCNFNLTRDNFHVFSIVLL